MIYVDRNRSGVGIPEIIGSKEHELLMAKLTQHFESEMSLQKMVPDSYDSLLDDEFVQRLMELFNSKCAICESKVNSDDYNNINRFRPSHNAMNLDGSVSRKHYYWEAFEWSNFYIICMDCNAAKRNRFPVEGKRANRKETKSKEKSLLLDPCNKLDFNSTSIRFLKDGTAVGIGNRAEITIEVFDLNREKLKNSRREIFKTIIESLNISYAFPKSKKGNEANQRLLEMIALDAPFLSVVREALASSKANRKSEAIRKKAPKLIQEKNRQIRERLARQIDPTESFSEIAAQKVFKSDVKKQVYTNLDFNSVENKESYFSSVKKIRKIEISNFKIIESLSIEFPEVTDENEPWLVLLGENGSGKSTVLQALALCLMGANKANALGLKANKFLNRNTKSKNGFVKVHLTGIDDPIEMKFSSKSTLFDSDTLEPIVLLQAFGSTRLMSPDLQEEVNHELINVANLFNPYIALLNIENWLGDYRKVKKALFDEICAELKRLLLLPQDRQITRGKLKEGGYGLFFKLDNQRKKERLLDLSAGYQAVVILSVTIMRKMLEVWEHFKLAEGVVLIDELGVHLHPRWKMQIVGNLRNIFPNLTFIITTHEPLCLRGVNKGEVLKMRSDEKNKVMALPIMISPDSLTIDQMITSGLFGLLTSYAPNIELKMNTYYFLKSKVKISKEEKAQLKSLEKELTELKLLGAHTLLEKTEQIVHETFIKEVYVKNHDSSMVDQAVKKELSKLFQ